LPDILSAADVAIGNDHGAGGVDNARWDGRHFLVDSGPDPAQHGKRNNDNGSKAN
jgi:hypothetical protein